MTRTPFTGFAAITALLLCLTACTTVQPPADVLTGTWYQNGGQTDLIWDFHADGTVAVHTWESPSVQHGIYRHLQDNHVALDFGGDETSVVQINVDGQLMTMINPGGARTMLERK